MDPVFQLERRVRREIERGRLFARGDRVVVAVSGGPDSLTLLAILSSLARDLDLGLVVAHLNHRLRGAAADRDALLVAAHARGAGLPVVIGTCDELALATSGFEERARRERSAFLARVAREHEARAIALGHTLDDQAETVLMRLGRGAGPASLGAMRARREDGIVRPLLRIRRAECARYLEARGLRGIVDETNLDVRFTRNRIRHQVLPALASGLGVDAAERLADLSRQLQVESDLAEAAVGVLLDREPGPDLAIGTVCGAGEAAGRIVHAWLVRRGLRLSRRQIEAVVDLARRGGPSDGIDAGSGNRVARCYERLVVVPLPRASRDLPFESLEWTIPGAIDLPSGWRLSAAPCPERTVAACPPSGADAGCGLELTIPAAALPDALTVRRPRPGDRIRLRAGRKKLSDLLVDARVPRNERSSLAVVSKGADIVWVPGIAAGWTGSAAGAASALVLLRAEPVDCRPGGRVVKNQEFRVSFA
ncbi:MAG: tRNA lysidine(34) synthetase TilS [Deltaproteobacteria bacterium]|nr:tRNA lysidine(34) synthetase TilS [Deltaproteobacteria bacterium]